ncbi:MULTISPECIES: TetR/AcrR family transcriptional regulator [Lactobacillaceae]|uniref:TetR/AcrR family transcriptional regulator n=1 Tax=Lactobacillaceae TaxID=33958 RepID=UPI0014564CA5|nr:TetR/AcrR family transcriptional regulator [Lactobacillus sp. HBUAS51381]NLR09107.1 TetR/AcrR family transcriptional regulator [Lactobacillus sp. HBUAS51381]
MTPQARKQQNLEAIYHALLALMAKKPLAAISITELCQRAQVSRTYFYRNYQDFNQIITRYQMQNMLRYLRRLPRSTQVNLADLMTHYFELVQSEATTYQLLIKNGQLDVLLQTFQTVFQLLKKQHRIHGSRINEPYYLEFFSGAVINVAVTWVTHGFVESPRYLGDLVARFASVKQL